MSDEKKPKKSPLQRYKKAHDDKPLFYLGKKSDIKDESIEDLGDMVNDLWQVIAKQNASDARFFLSNRKPVFLHLNHTIDLETFTPPILKSLLNDLVYFYFCSTINEDGEAKREYKTRTAPAFLLTQMLNNPLYAFPLPELERVVNAPYFTARYQLHQQPGYNAAAKTYYYAMDPKLKDLVIPKQPNAEDVAAAKRLLLEDVLIDFPFSSNAERANALSTMFEPFCRSWWDVTPFRLIESARAGTGKGLLGDVLLYPFLGEMPTRTNEPSNADGWQKLIVTLLLGLPAVLFFDNIKRPVNNGALESILTNPSMSDRLLGGNQNARIVNQATWLFAGNNVQIGEEIARRTVRIRMVALTANPHQRKAFVHNSLREWITLQRKEIVTAILTLIQNWIDHGRPLYEDAPVLGSYEKWSAEMYGILKVNDIPGFLGNIQEMINLDKYDWDDISSLIVVLWQLYRTEVFGASEVFQVIRDNEELPIDLGNNGEKAQRCKLGKLLSRNRERVFCVQEEVLKGEIPVTVALEVQFLPSGKNHQATLWRLKRISEQWYFVVQTEHQADAVLACWEAENEQYLKNGEMLIGEPKITIKQEESPVF